MWQTTPYLDVSTSKGKNATKSSQTQTRAGEDKGSTEKEVSNEQGSFGTATRHNEGSRICFGAVPVKVRTIDEAEEMQTYALLDNGSEVNLCDGRLAKRLRIDGERLRFTLTGINGSVKVEGRMIDIVVTSLDGSTEVGLKQVKTVKEIPISNSCPKTSRSRQMAASSRCLCS